MNILNQEKDLTAPEFPPRHRERFLQRTQGPPGVLIITGQVGSFPPHLYTGYAKNKGLGTHGSLGHAEIEKKINMK